MIRAVAIHGDADWIASAGFRSVKLWQRQHPSREIGSILPSSRYFRGDCGRQSAWRSPARMDRFSWLICRPKSRATRGKAHDQAVSWPGICAWRPSAGFGRRRRGAGMANGKRHAAGRLATVRSAKALRDAGRRSVDHCGRRPAAASVDACDPNRAAEGWRGDRNSHHSNRRGRSPDTAGKSRHLRSLPGSPRQFLSGSVDGTVRQWNADDGSQLKSWIHGDAVSSIGVQHGRRQIRVRRRGSHGQSLERVRAESCRHVGRRLIDRRGGWIICRVWCKWPRQI